MKPINSILLFCLASSCLFCISCADKDKDAEYQAYTKAPENQVKTALSSDDGVGSTENELAVDIPKTTEDISFNQSSLASEKNSKLSQELAAEKTQTKGLKASSESKNEGAAEKQKSPNLVSNTPDSEGMAEKSLSDEIVSAAPVQPKVSRGLSTGQTRGLTPRTENSIPTAKGALPLLVQDDHDFGTVTEGTKVTYRFVLKNAGTEELYIMDVDAGCSCTTTSYSFEPIKPGNSTPIDVFFDTNTKIGTQLKNIVISTNNGVKKARLKGTVMPKNKDY